MWKTKKPRRIPVHEDCSKAWCHLQKEAIMETLGVRGTHLAVLSSFAKRDSGVSNM